jgi:hypothetical protein
MQSSEQNKLIGNWIKDENEYQIALTYSEKKIGEFNRDDMTKLVEVMAQWRLLLGVTSDSTEAELIVICQFVYDNFKKFTLSDIKLAMNWTIAGKVEVGFVSQKNISSYYVSRALNGYEEVKRSIFNRMMEERNRYLNRLEDQKSKQIVETPEEKADGFKEFILSMYNQHINGGVFYDLGDMVYDWLKKTNQLDRNAEVINAAIKFGHEKLMEEKMSAKFKNKLYDAIDEASDERKKKKYAREYMIRKYFDKVGIGELVSKINPKDFQQ